MSDHRPVGVFDSGVGGLSIVREMRRQMPRLDIVYVSDARYLPYGEKSDAFIRERAFAISDFLLAAGARALVIACNTATAAAAHALRAHYALPIVGMFYGLHHWTAAHTGGVVDARFIALVDTAIESPLGQIAMVPMLAWIANSAPE